LKSLFTSGNNILSQRPELVKYFFAKNGKKSFSAVLPEAVGDMRRRYYRFQQFQKFVFVRFNKNVQ